MSDRSARDLLASLEDSLDLLSDYRDPRPEAGLPAEPLPSLLEQCVSMVTAERPPEPLRSVHHMACTGGTLICKCIAAMPNVTLLSEIDPLSRLSLPPPGKTPMFRPTDLIYSGRVALRPLDDDTIVTVFNAAVEALREALAGRGQHLCLRDHAHSQFCTMADPEARPTLLELLQGVAPVRAVVTVRHPVDSYLSVQKNAWLHFRPDTIDEYARRYMLFLDRHEGVETLRYEDFVAAPEPELERICDLLALPFVPGAEALLQVVTMSGDSGRKSDRISARPRRPVPDPLQAAARQSAALGQLCDRLGYAL